jgi:hypothetical protein
MGQLSDDVQEIRSLVAREDDVIVSHDLAHLIGVLQRIAAQELSGE